MNEGAVYTVRYVTRMLKTKPLYTSDKTILIGYPGRPVPVALKNAGFTLGLILSRMRTQGDWKAAKYVCHVLLHELPVAAIQGESTTIRVGNPGNKKPHVLNITTYTLGLMLGGALSELEEDARRLSDVK